MRSRTTVTTVAALLLLAPTLPAQTATEVEVEVGYQWVDVEGNDDMYRSQVDHEDGFVLGGLSVRLWNDPDADRWYDSLVIDASGFGGAPDGALRLDASLEDRYDLSLRYRLSDQFSALPGFANPFLGEVSPGPHTMDRTRAIADLRLELGPWKSVTPVIGWSWNRWDGPSLTTVPVGGNDYRIASDLDQTESELRLGAEIDLDDVHVTLMQGWRDFSSDEAFDLAVGEREGNLDRPVIGRDLVLDSYDRTVELDGSYPITTAAVAARVTDRVRVTGSFVRSELDRDVRETESLTGTGVLFDVARFFGGFQGSVDGTAEGPVWRGDVRVETDLGRRWTVGVGYQAHHRELDGMATLAELFSDVVTLGGTSADDLERLTEISNALERDEDALELSVQGRDLGMFRVWAEYTMVGQEIDLAPDAAQLLVPGGQEGSFDRDIDRFAVGGAVDLGDLTLLADWRVDDADTAVVRTDFTERERLRLRARWRIVEAASLTAVAEAIEADNLDTGIGYDADTDHFGAALDLFASEDLSARLAWDRYETDSELSYVRPETLTFVDARYVDDTDIVEGSLLWDLGRFDVQAGASRLESSGDLPLELDRIFGRVGIDLTDSFGVAVAYDSYDYQEDPLPLADFEADRIGAFLRWRR